MNEKDLRVVKTKEAIYNAFKSLLLEKEYEKISITDVTTLAKINRKTFYSHYETLDDLLLEIQSNLSKEFLGRTKGYDIIKDIDKITREFFLFSEEKGPFYEKITCGDVGFYVRQKMINKVMSVSGNTNENLNKFDYDSKAICIEFITSTTLQLYKRWIYDGKKIPVEKIISLTTNLIKNGISSVI